MTPVFPPERHLHRIGGGSPHVLKAAEIAGKTPGGGAEFEDRVDSIGERTLAVGPGQFDPLSGELALHGRTVKLRPRTAALLAHLVRHGDRMVSKDELMQVVWPDAVVTEDSLFQCMKEIRQALGEGGRAWIRTMPRQGYAFLANPRVPALDALSAAPPEVQPPTGDTAPPPPAGTSTARWPQLAALVFLACVVLAWALVLWSKPAEPPPGMAAPPLSFIVMPIVNLTGDAARENAVDDLTEALADALSRAAGTTVIAPSTAFTFKGRPVDVRRTGAELNVRYVLQGSLRVDGGRPVLSMRLADAATAVQLWNQEFRAAAMTGLRDLVSGRVADTLGLQLVRADARRAEEQRVLAPRTGELMSQARAALRSADDTGRGVLVARSLLETALREDQNLEEAVALLASTYLMGVRFSETRELELQRAAAVVERALALAPDSDLVRLAEGRLRYEQRRMPQALAAFERAIELNPGNAAALAARGAALVMLGRPAEALAPIERAMQLSPRDRQLPIWQTYRGVAHLHLGEDAAAVDWLTRSISVQPRSAMAHLFLASALALSGKTVQAQAQIAEVQRRGQGWTVGQFRAVEPSDAPAFRAQRQRVYEGMRLAGMPE